MDQELLTEDQAEGLLQVSRTTLWRLRRSGEVPFYRVGGKVRYGREDLQGWLKGQRKVMDLREPAAQYLVTRPARDQETYWKTAIEVQDWSFHEEPSGGLTHNLHPYPAKFPPQLPARLIEILTETGDVVLDPFCGSGTTLVEALRLGRAAVGADVNPIAVVASEAKTLRLSMAAGRMLRDLEDSLESDAARERGEGLLFSGRWPTPSPRPAPPIPNLERWFAPSAIKEIGFLLGRIDQLTSRDAAKVAKVVLSSILVTVSNQDSETRYTVTHKVLQPGQVLDSFLRKLRDVRDSLQTFSRLSLGNDCRVLLKDARHLRLRDVGKVDAVITSPPYANAFDYHLYHRHRMYWLGYDPSALQKEEIGSHLNYQRRGNGVETYREDMRMCLASIASVLRPGKPCVFVVGDSVFFGKVIDNARLITEVAVDAGFRCLAAVKRRIHPVKRSMIAAARRARVEDILLMVRP